MLRYSPRLKTLGAGLLVLALVLPGFALARGALNQDVRQETIRETICTPGYTKDVRPSTTYTNGVKRKLIREAGLGWDDSASKYELDHIIPLALGGHPRSLQNLELQPWEGDKGAKHKDRLEVKLQCLVCSGQVSLAQAQADIAGDWASAYPRYARVKCQRHKRR